MINRGSAVQVPQQEKVFPQDLRSNHRHGQNDPLKWEGATSSKVMTLGEISIQEQRKSLPIYKLRDPLLEAIREVCTMYISVCQKLDR